jgi:hypothetical protein
MRKFMRPNFKSFSMFFVLVLLVASGIQPLTTISAQDDVSRDIISEDFLKSRPAKSKSSPGPKGPWSGYRQATTSTKPFDRSRLQVGLTIWKLEPASNTFSAGQRAAFEVDRNSLQWVPRRVEADARFSKGDTLRLSIESPRAGYLYVVNRDRLADGSFGETNLIFPTEGEDNRLRAGKLIDIPGQGEVPFTATPKPNQSGELLTFIVTSSPLRLPLSKAPLPISKPQLAEWEQKWGAEADRFEMNGGAGQARTIEEQLAASSNGTRQLTREDPLPQTVYSLVPKNRNALLFNVMLSYVR